MEERKEIERQRVCRILTAIDSQRERGVMNASLPYDELKQMITSEGSALLDHLACSAATSARKIVRSLRVARTIADLEHEELIDDKHLFEAHSFNALESIWKYVEAR